MNRAHDRRAPGSTRIPFEAMVEIGGALGPSFEAQALNLSEEGMHLRTAYLPEVGQPVMCRFDAGHGLAVVAAGEVLWNQDAGEGGEFGIRFTNLDGASAAALERIVGMGAEGALPRAPQGRKVRLHIDGLASPMRARVKGVQGANVTAFSELGFLQVGKSLDLEDASTGDKRSARIDRVEVEVSPESRIPQLVVTLRYDDMSDVDVPVEVAGRDDTPEPQVLGAEEEISAPTPCSASPTVPTTVPYVRAADDVDDAPRGEMREAEDAPEARGAEARERASDEDDDEMSEGLKSTFARTAAKVGPAVGAWASLGKAKVAEVAALLAKKRAERAEKKAEAESPVRRTTAPAPGGGLHAAGRKVVRQESADDKQDDKPAGKMALARGMVTKKRAAVAGALSAAMILGYVGCMAPSATDAPATETTTAAALPAAPVAATALPDAPVPEPSVRLVDDQIPEETPEAEPVEREHKAHKKKAKPKPFSHGRVRRANVLRLKMDGDIEKILGASQPTGFTVVIPDRKSLDPAGPLAKKDSRVERMRVLNGSSGAELSVSFKDGVPNYLVRAKGDVLEILLSDAPQAKKKSRSHSARHKKRSKRHHDRD